MKKVIFSKNQEYQTLLKATHDPSTLKGAFSCSMKNKTFYYGPHCNMKLIKLQNYAN